MRGRMKIVSFARYGIFIRMLNYFEHAAHKKLKITQQGAPYA
jgi:hypothetical protein